MDMDQLQKNLEEALEQIDLLTEERDSYKGKYENAKGLIDKLKGKILDLKSEKESDILVEDCGELEKENVILRHELKAENLKLSMRDENENLRFENETLKN